MVKLGVIKYAIFVRIGFSHHANDISFCTVNAKTVDKIIQLALRDESVIVNVE